MRIEYFSETETLSIRLNANLGTESEEIAPDVVVDFDASGGIVGLEIDLASAKVDLKTLDLKGLLIPQLASK